MTDAEERLSAYYPLTKAKFTVPDDRPDLLLMQLETDEGTMRFSLSRTTAIGLARSIAVQAEKLAPDTPIKPTDLSRPS